MKKRKSASNKFAKNEEHAKWVIKRRRLLKEKAAKAPKQVLGRTECFQK